jgi:hypothetical protein
VYRARLVVFVISVLLAWIESLSKGYVFHGQGHCLLDFSPLGEAMEQSAALAGVISCAP